MKTNKPYSMPLVEGVAIADPALAQQYAVAQKQLNDKDAQIVALQKQINTLETAKMQIQKAMVAIEQKAAQNIQKPTTPNQPPQPAQTQPIANKPTSTTPVGTQQQPTKESFNDILKVNKINESIFDTTEADEDELQNLKNYLDAENIDYFEDEGSIDFDEDKLTPEWRDVLDDYGIKKLEDFTPEEYDGEASIGEEEEDTELSPEEHEKIDEDKVFYVKVEDEGAAFIGKIYKLQDDDEWLSKLVVGENETFDKLYYEPEWDEVDIIAFLRENYADAELISKEEYNDHLVNDNYIEEGYKIKSLDSFLK